MILGPPHRRVPEQARAKGICRGRDASHPAPPARIRTSTFMHTALTLDVWQRSAHRDRDAGHVVGESSDPRAAAAAPTTLCRADCDGTGSSATGAAGDAERSTADR